MLNNFNILMSSFLKATSTSTTITGVVEQDGTKYNGVNTLGKSFLYADIKSINDGTSTSSNTSLVLCSEHQNITNDMYNIVGGISTLTYVSSVITPIQQATQMYGYILTVKNTTSQDIIVKSVALICTKVLLDVININPITIRPNETYTFNYKF